MNPQETEKKAAMKNLRAVRKAWIKKAAAKVKAQKKGLKAIRGRLEQSACTVPEIAEASGVPADEVLWYVAAMKKYGEIVEANKDGSYFQYELADGVATEDS